VFRKVVLIASLIVAAVGGVSIAMGIVARSRFNPISLEWDGVHYDVVRRQEGEAVVFDVRGADGKVIESLAGSTDLACDPPFLMLLDVDGNGTLDVYHHHCGGHGYLRYHTDKKSFEYVNLGQWDPDDAPAVSGFWGKAIAGGGLRLITEGAGLVFIALAGFLVSMMLLRLRRHVIE
jgi:hypothetical protein